MSNEAIAMGPQEGSVGKPGQLVHYLSYGKHWYAGILAKVHEEGNCEVLVVPARCKCCKTGSVQGTSAYLQNVRHDETGTHRHSWQSRGSVFEIDEQTEVWQREKV